MKTIVLGYADADAKGPAKVLAGPEVDPRQQVLMVADIKLNCHYPSGVVRVELCELLPRNIGIQIPGQKPTVTEPTKKKASSHEK